MRCSSCPRGPARAGKDRRGSYGAIPVLTSAGTNATSGGPMSSLWRAGGRLGVLRSRLSFLPADSMAAPSLIAAGCLGLVLGMLALLIGRPAGPAEGNPAIDLHPMLWLGIGIALPLLLGTGTLLRSRQRERALR